MTKGQRGKTKIVSSNTEKPRQKGERHQFAKEEKCSEGLTKVSNKEYGNANSPSLDVEEAWIMETSSGYEYDFAYENATRTDSWGTNKPPEGISTDVTSAQGTEQPSNYNTNVQRNQKAKTESREQKIKTLKALLRKQEKVVNILRPDQASVSLEKVNNCGKSSKKSRLPTVKKRLGRGLETSHARRSKRKKAEINDITSYRDVDIWMSRGDLTTKDESLGCVGLIQMAKFH